MSGTSGVKDLTELIEDWLDNDHHSARLPSSMDFKDIQTVARLLAPRIAKFIKEDSTIVAELMIGDYDE